MVRIPHIRIPSVRVGGIDPTSDIGTAIGGVQPTPITYLTRWKIVGNSEVHGNEIWSCGEYSEVDGKYHIVVLPQGGSISDIALTEPLRKVDDVADNIEFPSDTDGKALVTRNIGSENREKFVTNAMSSQSTMALVSLPTGIKVNNTSTYTPNILINKIPNTIRYSAILNESLAVSQFGSSIEIINTSIEQTKAAYDTYFTELGAVNIIYELATPTTELVDAPQIAEADSYSCEISQGGKAVEWSSFETDSSE